MAIRAGIDVGTNTILLLIAEVEGGVVRRVFEDRVRVVRLGQAVDKNRAFLPEAMERARACFQDYSEVLKKFPGVDVRAIATSGSRDASNSADFFAEIRTKYGIAVRIVDGEEEAQLSFQGALPDGTKEPENFAILDIGGGSTELVGLKSGGWGRLFRYSFDMGCVRLTERFLSSDPPSASQIQELRAFVKAELAKQPEIIEAARGRRLIGVAGTATYLASASSGLPRFDVDKVHGAIVSLEQVRALLARFSGMKAADRLGIGGMDTGRADVIVAGALILEEVLMAAGLGSYQASVRGLRYGAVM